MSTLSDPLELAAGQQIIQAVESLPEVAQLYSGVFGEIAVLYPGQRLRGLRVSDDRLSVHVVVDVAALREAESLLDVSERIRAAVTPFTTLPVDVVIADAVSSHIS